METTPKIRKVRDGFKQAQGRAANRQRQIQMRTVAPSANGFLRHSFKPLCTRNDMPSQDLEGYFASLEKVINHYGFEIINTQAEQFPYNILLSYDFARKQVQELGRQIDLSIQRSDGGSICLATVETYDPGTSLYYIPVQPLLKLLKKKEQKRAAELLLSVFAYLYHVAGVPCFRDEYSILCDYYDYVEDCFLNNIDGEDETNYNQNLSTIRAAFYLGDEMMRKIYNPYQLNHFGERIDAFICKNDFQAECLKVAKEGYALFGEFPDARIHRYTSAENCGDDYDYDGIIRTEQYLCFVGSTEGAIFNYLEQMINDEFNQIGNMEIPTLNKCFNTEFVEDGRTLDFERRLFSLVNELCYLLNNLPWKI